jgi:hypothetical protein
MNDVFLDFQMARLLATRDENATLPGARFHIMNKSE